MPLRSFTQAETTLTERRRLERPLLVMVWLGVAAFSIAEGRAPHFVLATAAVAANLLAASRGKELYVRRVFINLGLALATVVLVVETVQTRLAEVVLLSHYLILIQLCKLFEQKRNRDYVQLLTMSLLLVVSASLMSDAMLLAGVVLAFLALACHTAMVFTLKRGLDAAVSRKLFTESRPPPVQQVAWNVLRNWPGRTLGRVLAMSLLAILTIAAATFLLAPRTLGAAGGLFASPRPAAGSGFSDNIELGSAQDVYLSNRVIMRVRLSRAGHGVGATGARAYLRGLAFDAYAKSRWSRSAAISESESAEGRELLAPGQEAPPDALVQEVTMVAELLPTLFVCYPAVRVEMEPRRLRVDAADNYCLPRTDTSSGLASYTAYTWPQPLTAERRMRLAQVRAQQQQAPASGLADPIEVSPRVAEQARQWCRDLLEIRQGQPRRRDELDLQIAARLAERLGQRCRYSLDLSGAEPDRDGVEDFVFYLRRGHCEYFASATAVMCHSLGVRARVATGFHLAERDADGKYTVRDRDAHAWTEVFTASTDWVPIDPSPPSTESQAASWWQSVQDFWQSVNFAWYETVAGYDATSRKALLQRIEGIANRIVAAGVSIGETFRAFGEAVGRGVENLLVHGHVDAALVVLAVAFGAVALVVEAVLIARALRRRRHTPWSGLGLAVPDWQLRFVADLFAMLRRAGLPMRAAQTARSAAREAAQRLRLPPDVLAKLIELYYRLRWGGAPAPPEEIAAAEGEVRKLQQTAKR